MWYYVYIQKRRFFYNQMRDKKYYNLYKDVKNKILTGEYPADTKLPSKRLMSDKTGYSLITVERAYFMLEDEPNGANFSKIFKANPTSYSSK